MVSSKRFSKEWWGERRKSFVAWRDRHLLSSDFVWRKIVDSVIALIIFVVLWFAVLPYVRSSICSDPTSFADRTSKIGAVLCAALVALVIPAIWRTFQNYRRSFRVFGETVGISMFVAPGLLVFATAAFSIWLAVPGKWTATVGALFPIALAFITIGGFLFTLNKLDDILSRIHSYADLLEHFSGMLERETTRANRTEQSTGQVLIVANAITFGNISEFSKYPSMLRVLCDALTHRRINVRVICLDFEKGWVPDNMESEQKTGPHFIGQEMSKSVQEIKEQSSLGTFYWAWNNSGRWDESLLKKPYYQALSMMDAIENCDVDHGLEIAKVVWTFSGDHACAPLHMVLTSDSALLFHVLDFPIRGNGRPPHIQVVGSEVTDPSTVQQLLRAFKYHARQFGEPKIANPPTDAPPYDLDNDPVLHN